ncbi:hypothetical protein BRADI_4g08395v3 [Brachypodium distachyon]|uniref:Uncharacterized protein n=1 Tax=Brachypodium distachyon TaxID=15368 RepID=A0A0Q3HF16_BRADI|nr:hypothetical protein BRADI_4g08395v3 [Brachypodium distachyon]
MGLPHPNPQFHVSRLLRPNAHADARVQTGPWARGTHGYNTTHWMDLLHGAGIYNTDLQKTCPGKLTHTWQHKSLCFYLQNRRREVRRTRAVTTASGRKSFSRLRMIAILHVLPKIHPRKWSKSLPEHHKHVEWEEGLKEKPLPDHGGTLMAALSIEHNITFNMIERSLLPSRVHSISICHSVNQQTSELSHMAISPYATNQAFHHSPVTLPEFP